MGPIIFGDEVEIVDLGGIQSRLQRGPARTGDGPRRKTVVDDRGYRCVDCGSRERQVKITGCNPHRSLGRSPEPEREQVGDRHEAPRKGIRDPCQEVPIIAGGQGRNRTADTGIFRTPTGRGLTETI